MRPGFLAIGSKTHNTQNRQQFVLDLADEQIDVTVAGVSRPDGRLRPLPRPQVRPDQPARLLRALRHLPEHADLLRNAAGRGAEHQPVALDRAAGEAAERRRRCPSSPPSAAQALEEQLAELIKARDALTMEENFTMKGIRTRTLLAMLRFRLASFQPDGTPRTYAMGVRERFEPIDSPLYTRGELESPGEIVPRGLIAAWPGASSRDRSASGSGRLELAEWLASRENPLTARVMVNRVWLHLFGRGLVATPDNFGAAGQPPSHPELLDYPGGHVHGRRLVGQGARSARSCSAAPISSRSSHDAKNFEADPDNTLVWRMSKKRLEAEAIRDAVLSRRAAG